MRMSGSTTGARCGGSANAMNAPAFSLVCASAARPRDRRLGCAPPLVNEVRVQPMGQRNPGHRHALLRAFAQHPRLELRTVPLASRSLWCLPWCPPEFLVDTMLASSAGGIKTPRRDAYVPGSILTLRRKAKSPPAIYAEGFLVAGQ